MTIYCIVSALKCQNTFKWSKTGSLAVILGVMVSFLPLLTGPLC